MSGCDARQFGQARVDPGEVLPVQVVGDGHRHIARALGELPLQLAALIRSDGDDLADGVQGAVDVDHLVARDQQAEVRPVGRQLHPVAVQDTAARRRDQAVIELVAGRQLAIAAGLDELKLHQAPAERQDAHAGHAAHHQGAPVEGALALIDLVEEDRRLDAHRNRVSASSNRSIRRWENG